jgi:hypothetical protein
MNMGLEKKNPYTKYEGSNLNDITIALRSLMNYKCLGLEGKVLRFLFWLYFLINM